LAVARARAEAAGYRHLEFVAGDLRTFEVDEPVDAIVGRESGGKFTKDYETLEYKCAVAYHRALWDAGLFYPDSPSLSGSPAGALYYAGKWIFSPHAGWSLVAYQTAWERANADPTASRAQCCHSSRTGPGVPVST
jgi:hypothetical protein